MAEVLIPIFNTANGTNEYVRKGMRVYWWVIPGDNYFEIDETHSGTFLEGTVVSSKSVDPLYDREVTVDCTLPNDEYLTYIFNIEHLDHVFKSVTI